MHAETLDVDEFLCDVSLHLRRRDIRTLLHYLGMPAEDIEKLLSQHRRSRQGSERGLLTSSGLVVDGSSAINFLDQRKRAMRAWWNYAANTNSRVTPAQQNVKVVESRCTALPGIREGREDGEGYLVSQLQRDSSGNVTNFLGEASPRTASYAGAKPEADERPFEIVVETTSGSPRGQSQSERGQSQNGGHSLLPPVAPELSATPPLRREQPRNQSAGQFPNLSSGPIVQIPSVDASDTASQTQSEPPGGPVASGGKHIRWGPGTNLPRGAGANRVTVNEAGVTLEELLRKLWRCLQSCGLTRVVDELQQRWMIRVDTKQGKADMYPKMTWGTPPPPQTPFTYPPYKKIGHMAVMGAPMVIETRPLESIRAEKVLVSSSLPSSFEILTPRVGERAVSTSVVDRPAYPSTVKSFGRSSNEHGASSSDGVSTATSFPARDAWKMRTDTVRRRGASLTAHVLVENVTLPANLVAAWGSSLHVTPLQMREKAARVFLNYVTRDGRDLCRAVDRVERIRGLVVENALKRFVNGSMTSSMDAVGSELVMQCRCLYPETVEQLWLWYQSGQLRESMQAGLVTKRVRHACAVEQIRLRVYIAEEEYRRALGLLRRKPMPNTKTGRYYVTSGSGGVAGGTSGLTYPQRQALMSVTKYVKLPAPSPSKDATNPYASFPIPSAGNESEMRGRTAVFGGKRTNPNRALVDKILNKEVLSLRQRVRMCEDEWCEFAARDLAVMLRCARNVMQRRITGATTREQLTPKCISLSLLRSLHKVLISRGRDSSTAATPRGTANSTSITNSYSSIALYPNEIAFSSYDLVASPDDDEVVVKSRKQEERDFASAFAHFADLVAELSSCRNRVQDKIIARLTTNPTVAHSKQLYLTKDIYLLTERWRSLVSKDFNIANDPTVQLLSRRILSDPSMSFLIPIDIQEQFPGFIGLLPATFHVADQVLEKLQSLLTSAYGGGNLGPSVIYPSVDGQHHTMSVRLVV